MNAAEELRVQRLRQAWHDEVIRYQGPGKANPKCPNCNGTGKAALWGEPETCPRCFPENNPPVHWLHPRKPDPEKQQQREERRSRPFAGSLGNRS